MAHDNHRDRPVGPIIDHPAFTNYEFCQQVSQAAHLDVETELGTAIAMEMAIHGPGPVQNAPNDRFLSHRPQLTLAADAEDPLEVESEATRATDQQWTNEVLHQRESRTLTREAELHAAGVHPEAPDSVWENARGIEQGRVISLAHYGPSGNVLVNTSVDDEEVFVSAGSPTQCRAHRADFSFDLHLADDIESKAENARAEKKRVAAWEDEWDRQEAVMKRLRGEVPALKAALAVAADTWKANDLASFVKWEKQLANAFRCSTALPRVWQIAVRFGFGVPIEVHTAVENLAISYSEQAEIRSRIMRIQREIGFELADRHDSLEEKLKCDDCWTVLHQEQPVGLDIPLTGPVWIGTLGEMSHPDLISLRTNGFSNYVPKGEGMAMLQHLTANLEARKGYVAETAAYHAENYPNPDLVIPMKTFIDSAVFALDQAQAMIGGSNPWGAYFDAIGDLRTSLLDYHQTLSKDQEAGLIAYASYFPLPDDESENDYDEAQDTELTNDNCVGEEEDSHYMEWLALEARYADAHSDDTEEEVNARLAELRLNPYAEEFDGEQEMVTLHSHEFSDLF
jgi:hypothetical protein